MNVARRSAESSAKRASFGVTYLGLSVLRFRYSAYKAISKKWHRHKSAAYRKHDIAYSQSNNLTDEYTADTVLADKALDCVIERFDFERESRRCYYLGSDGSQDFFFDLMPGTYAERKEQCPHGELFSYHRVVWRRLWARSDNFWNFSHDRMWTNRTINFISTKTTQKLQFPRVRTKCETNEFFKHAVLRKRPRCDALETVDVVHGNNSNNVTDDGEDEEYSTTLRTNYNTMRCKIRCTYRISFDKLNSVGSLLRFSSKRILRPRRWTYRST